MHVFYSSEPVTDPFLLSEEESRHCVKVLRMTEGDTICITDGKGNWYDAVISSADARRCMVSITHTRSTDARRPWSLTIAMAPTKNMDRMEWFVEKSTEVGIDQFMLIDTHRTERTRVKEERLHKVAISAMKQSMSAFLPRIHPQQPLPELLSRPFTGKKLIAHCLPGADRPPHISSLVGPGEDVLLLIGPEGDFTPEEVAHALAAGFEPVSLGEARLRTETAALYGCIAINALNESRQHHGTLHK